LQIAALCTLGIMNQMHGAAGVNFNAEYAGLSPKKKADMFEAFAKIIRPRPPTTLTSLFADLPNTLNELFGSWYAIAGLATAVAGTVYVGVQQLTSKGPVTVSARRIEKRIISAVSNINAGLNNSEQAPLHQIAGALKGLLELRLVLNDALCKLPEKYNNMRLLQECCDKIDTMLNNAEIAYSYRYVAGQDKTLQSLIDNLHKSALAKVSFEHLTGLQRSVAGKPVSTLGNLAETFQWARNGFDPVNTTTNSVSIAARVVGQTVRDGVQALVGAPVALERREDQVKVLNYIRSLLISPVGTQKTWFEKLHDLTGVSKFLRLCIEVTKVDQPAASSVKNNADIDSTAATKPIIAETKTSSQHTSSTVYAPGIEQNAVTSPLPDSNPEVKVPSQKPVEYRQEKSSCHRHRQ